MFVNRFKARRTKKGIFFPPLTKCEAIWCVLLQRENHVCLILIDESHPFSNVLSSHGCPCLVLDPNLVFYLVLISRRLN